MKSAVRTDTTALCERAVRGPRPQPYGSALAVRTPTATSRINSPVLRAANTGQRRWPASQRRPMPFDTSTLARPLGITLNADQTKAMAEIRASVAARKPHLLTGFAGAGKTLLTQVLAVELRAQGLDVILSAPTHKAVAVLSRKLRAAGIKDEDVPCVTIHKLLSLKPKVQREQQIFAREKGAQPVVADVVVIDEASMVSADLMKHIRRYLPRAAVLFVGDPAQLPPVGEDSSEAFNVPRKSHLDTIVRQDAGNPILDAADIIRRSQGSAADWSWCKPAMAKPYGVYVPGERTDAWMRRAFTSPEFAADTERFRYLCWTNARVAQVNARCGDGSMATTFRRRSCPASVRCSAHRWSWTGPFYSTPTTRLLSSRSRQRRGAFASCSPRTTWPGASRCRPGTWRCVPMPAARWRCTWFATKPPTKRSLRS